MTNKLNRSDYLILDTLHGSNMTDQFHSMTIEEIMEETGNVLGVRMTVYRMVTKLVKLVFEMAMDTYGHYFSGIVVLVEVEPNTYKMIEK